MTPEERFERLEVKLHNISDILAETAAMNAETAAQSRKAETELRAGLQKTDTVLRRAIRLAVREARAERERRRIADEHLDQLITKLSENLQRFLESRAHHNGGKPDPTSPPAA